MANPIVVGGKKIGRIRASYLLTREAFRFLRADTEMLWVPVIGVLVQLFMIGLLCVGVLLPLGMLTGWATETSTNDYYAYGVLFFVYLICAFVVAYSQAIITHIVYVRAHGGDATLKDGVRVSASHAGSLFIWACITSTVGIILRMIAERSEILMKITAVILGSAWSVLTYFVVPAILIDKKKGIGAISHSGSIFKRTWGETIIINIGIGLTFFIAIVVLLFVLIGVLFLFGNESIVAVSAGAAFFGSLIVLVIVSSVLDSILRTILYIYANEGVIPSNFNAELLTQILGKKHEAQKTQEIVEGGV